MKKILFLASLAAVAMTSCTSESNEYVGGNDNTPKEIALSAFAQKATRAAWGGTTFPGSGDGYGIKLASYDATKGSIYFTDGDFTYSTGTGAGIIYHDATTPRYWPFADTWLHFLGVTYMTTAADNVITTNFTSYGTNGTAAVTLTDNSTKQNDLMYAIGYGHVQQTGNALVFPENVPMTYHHALASMSFRVKASVASAITVTGIKVNGAYESGVYNITHTGYNSQSSTESVSGTWDVSAQSADVRTVPESNIGALNTTFSTETGLMVVPVSAGSSFSGITIDYTMSGVNYSYTYTPASLVLEQGKKYLYDITFTLHEILVNPTVTDWDASTPTTNVEIPMTAYAHNTSADNTGNFPTAGNIAATAGTYSFQVTGLASTDDITVAEGAGGTGTLTSVSKVYNTTSKVAVVTFQVPANATNSAKTYVINVTDSGTSGSTHKTTITVTQEAGA